MINPDSVPNLPLDPKMRHTNIVFSAICGTLVILLIIRELNVDSRFDQQIKSSPLTINELTESIDPCDEISEDSSDCDYSLPEDIRLCAPVYLRSIDKNYVDTLYSWVTPFWKGLLSNTNTTSTKYLIDIGANVGLTSIIPAKLGFRVVGFEPEMLNQVFLQRSICSNGNQVRSNYYLIKAAVGAKSGQTTFHVAQRSDGSSISEAAASQGSKTSSVTVPIVTIDEWMESHPEYRPEDCAYMKLDVQGFELRVLEGARKFLLKASNDLIVRVEIEGDLEMMAIGSTGGVLAIMKEFGYEVIDVQGDYLFQKSRKMKVSM